MGAAVAQGPGGTRGSSQRREGSERPRQEGRMCGLGPEQHFGHSHRQDQAEALLEPRERSLKAWVGGGLWEGGSGGWAGSMGHGSAEPPEDSQKKCKSYPLKARRHS